MPSANLALTFGAIVAGAVVVEYGTRNVKSAFAAAPASGSPPAAVGGSPGRAAGPLPGVTAWGRTDQGVDASAAPGSPVRSIYGGVVSAIVPNWYSGQPAVYIDSPGLPGDATGIYYAEQLTPSVKVGQRVSAGQQIGTVAQSGTGLELGLAKGTQTLTQATTGYAEAGATRAGELMRQLLQSIGVQGL